MRELTVPWLSWLFVVGGLGWALTRLLPGKARVVGISTTVVHLALALGALGEVTASGGSALVDPWASLPSLSRSTGLVLALQVDALSSFLLPYAALLWLFVLLVAPRSDSGSVVVGRRLRAELLVLALFCSVGPVVLSVFWALSGATLWQDLRRIGNGRAARVAARYLGASAALFAVGGALAWAGETGGALETAGMSLVLAAVLVRKGIVPVHSWWPEAFEHGSLPVVVLFSAPQVGSYVAARLVLLGAPTPLLTVMGVLALGTAVYGAALALVQTDPRRAFGYFFMSQSALVLAGLETASVVGVTGGLAMWVSSGLALAGLGAALWVVEARRGRLSLAQLHGGYGRMPVLAASFLLLGLASVGFPGTLGFVGQELLVDGATTEFPHIGFAVVAAVALNGVCVLRMYFSLFCGARDTRTASPLLPRERVAFAALTGLLLVGGLVPGPMLASRERAAQAVVEAMASRQPASEQPAGHSLIEARPARSWARTPEAGARAGQPGGGTTVAR